MRRKLIATLIICITLVMQFGASLSGAAAARDGVVWGANCHRPVATISDAAPADTSSPSGPAQHDHASCSFCQIGFTAALLDAAVFEAPIIEPYRRVALVAPDAPARGFAFNRSASARAPPSFI